MQGDISSRRALAYILFALAITITAEGFIEPGEINDRTSSNR